jgi:alpha-beta hydrolase superfamily lysophospholipase
MKNNSLKLLAEGLAKAGIATLRFDKRGVAASKDALKKEEDIRFDDYVKDAQGWVRFLRQDTSFSSIVVVGHSEGSLIGMIAAQSADRFVSIAGAGESADKLIKRQLSGQPQRVQEMCAGILDSLKSGHRVENVLPMLYNLFRPSVQPYMISWFRYDPQVELKKLTIPVLIVQGTNDLQVTADDAKRLSTAHPTAQVKLIDKMNHIFRIVEGDKAENIASYNNAQLPLAPGLVPSVAAFILGR